MLGVRVHNRPAHACMAPSGGEGRPLTRSTGHYLHCAYIRKLHVHASRVPLEGGAPVYITPGPALLDWHGGADGLLKPDADPRNQPSSSESTLLASSHDFVPTVLPEHHSGPLACGVT